MGPTLRSELRSDTLVPTLVRHFGPNFGDHVWSTLWESAFGPPFGNDLLATLGSDCLWSILLGTVFGRPPFGNHVWSTSWRATLGPLVGEVMIGLHLGKHALLIWKQWWIRFWGNHVRPSFLGSHVWSTFWAPCLARFCLTIFARLFECIFGHSP